MRNIHVGVCGYGQIANTHMKAMQQSNDQIRGVPYAVLTRQQRAEHAAQFSRVYSTEEDFFNDPQIELVDICTPNFRHYTEGKQAILQGKAVYMEKPISNNLGDAWELVELAREHHTINAVALNNRFNPNVIRAKDIIASGIMGRIVNFKTSYYHHSYIEPTRLMSWRQSFAFSGGGAIMDLGIHTLDLVRFLLGEVASVTMRSKTVYPQRYIDQSYQTMAENDTDEYSASILEMQSGVLGFLDVSRVSYEPRGGALIEIYGTQATLKVYDDHIVCLQVQTGKPLDLEAVVASPFYTYITASLIPCFNESLAGFELLHGCSMQNILRMMDGGEVYPEVPTFLEGYRSQCVVDALQRSNQEKTSIYLI